MRFFGKRGGKIGVIELFGSIGGTIRSADYDQIFTRALEDKKIKAVVLDIDSPGGAVPASDYIYRRAKRVAEYKPVVASIRGVGASGGYYIACAAHRIVAVPGALVGSIGVLSVRPVLQELLHRVGVTINVSKSGEFKDLGAPWRESTPEEDRKIQDLIDESYDSFVDIVSKARNMDEATVKEIATGEVYWAPRAKELGLVDELGDLDTAIDLAMDQSGAARRPVHLRPKRSLRARLLGPLAESLISSAADEFDRRLWSNYLRY